MVQEESPVLDYHNSLRRIYDLDMLLFQVLVDLFDLFLALFQMVDGDYLLQLLDKHIYLSEVFEVIVQVHWYESQLQVFFKYARFPELVNLIGAISVLE